MGVLAAGAPAPAFSLATSGEELFTRDSLLGRRTGLVSYPFAFSPVCTDQLAVHEEVLEDLAEEARRSTASPATRCAPSRRSRASFAPAASPGARW